MTERPTNIVSRNLKLMARDPRSRTRNLPRLTESTLEVSSLKSVYEVHGANSVSVAVESRSSRPEEAGAALLEIRALDGDGNRQTLTGWAFVSARVGEYHYLEPQREAETALTRFSINIPDNVTRLEIVGHSWKRAVTTEIIGSILFWSDDTGPLQRTETGRLLEKTASRYSEEFDVPTGASSVELRLPIRGGEVEGRIPFRFEFYRDNGSLALPASDMPQHKKLGPIRLCQTMPNTETIAQMSVPIPEQIKTVRIAGVDWGRSTPTVLGNSTVSFQYRDTSEAYGFLDSLGPNDRLMLIDTTAPPVGHQTLSLRPNNLAKAWADLGIKIIFLPFSTIQDQPILPYKNIMQISRADFEPIKNWLLENRLGANNTYVCSSFPSHDAIGLIDSFNLRGWNTVYESRDDMEEFNRVGYSKWYHPQLERRVIERAKQVTAVSASLASKLKSVSRKRAEVDITPNGVSDETINEGAFLRTEEMSNRRSRSAKVGYVGHLTDAWFDWDLIKYAAAKRPDYIFEIVGHGMPDRLNLPNNISYLGPKTHDELPEIVSDWRVGVIPFLDSPLTRSVDPNKIYEYYAWGLPCVSAEMGNVREYPSASVYRTRDDFLVALDKYLTRSLSVDELDTVEKFLGQCSWQARASQTSELFFR